jgi:hypothetical protein
MKRSRFTIYCLTAILLGGLASAMAQTPLGTEFTYQGQLKDGGVSADGDYDFVFRLYDADTGGAQVGSAVTVDGWPVVDGLFTLQLDFGPGAFDSDARWLEVSVRPGAGGSEYTTLSPRQPVTAAPVALYALDGPGSAGYWAASGSDIYNTNSGNVGVGTPSPEHPFHLVGDLRADGRVAVGNSAGFGPSGNWDWNLDLSATMTDFSGGQYYHEGMKSVITVDPDVDLTGENARQIFSHDIYTVIPDGNEKDIFGLSGPYLATFHYGSGDVWALGGVGLGAELHGTGSVTWQGGAAAWSQGAGAGSIVHNFGLTVYTGHRGSDGSITNDHGIYVLSPAADQPLENHYGIYLENQDFGANDSYAIYVAGGDTYLNGDLEVTGTLSKGGGSFKIDHPLDPENKILYHSFVESPDMMNVYNGNVVTGDDGRAWVRLPDYFEALNRDFRYQLTVLGQFAQAIVEQEIENGGFQIRTDKPGVKVSWQVTGIRKDPWAERNRIPTEEDKLPDDQGKYLHPELYGQPAEMGVHYRHPRPPMVHERDRAWQHVAP